MARRQRVRPHGHTHAPSCSLEHEENGSVSLKGIADHVDQQIRPVVESRGFAVQQIDTGDARTSFCYTIGLTGRGYPELLVSGFHPVLAFTLLRMLGDRLLAEFEVGTVVDRTRLLLPLGPEGMPVAFWLLAPTPEQDRDEGPGLAKFYYQQWVPHLRVKAAGWPCDRCTAHYGERARCTCKFACTWHACALQDGTIPIDEIEPGHYVMGVDPAQEETGGAETH